jgi:hypothetical protein
LVAFWLLCGQDVAIAATVEALDDNVCRHPRHHSLRYVGQTRTKFVRRDTAGCTNGDHVHRVESNGRKRSDMMRKPLILLMVALLQVA